MECKVQDLLPDQRTVIIGALSMMPCQVFNRRKGLLFDAGNLLQSARLAAFAFLNDQPECKKEVRIYSEGVGAPKDTQKNYKHFAVGVYTNGDMVALSENTTWPPKDALPFYVQKAISPWSIQEAFQHDKGMRIRVIMGLVFLVAAAIARLAYFDIWIAAIAFGVGVALILEVFVLKPFLHHRRRVTILEALNRLNHVPKTESVSSTPAPSVSTAC